jgi:hypothetical protein
LGSRLEATTLTDIAGALQLVARRTTRHRMLAHGGTSSLHESKPHGLVARIELPIRAESWRSAARLQAASGACSLPCSG